MLGLASQQSSFSGTRTAFTPAQLATAAVAVLSTGPSKKPPAPKPPCGMHSYSLPERFTPHSVTVWPALLTRWLPDTCRPVIAGAALTLIGARDTHAAPAPTSATSGRTTSQVRARFRHIGSLSPIPASDRARRGPEAAHGLGVDEMARTLPPTSGAGATTRRWNRSHPHCGRRSPLVKVHARRPFSC